MTTTIDQDNTVALQAELTEIIREAERRPESEAAVLAGAIVRGLRQRMPGESIYIASGLSVRERAERDQCVRRDYNGRNREEVCRTHDISKTQLYRILARR